MKFTPKKIKLKIINKLWRKWIGMAIYPYVILVKTSRKDKRLINHEKIHIKQQEKLFKKYWYFGVALWWIKYLCSKQFRFTREYEAYQKGHKLNHKQIMEVWNNQYKKGIF